MRGGPQGCAEEPDKAYTFWVHRKLSNVCAACAAFLAAFVLVRASLAHLVTVSYVLAGLRLHRGCPLPLPSRLHRCARRIASKNGGRYSETSVLACGALAGFDPWLHVRAWRAPGSHTILRLLLGVPSRRFRLENYGRATPCATAIADIALCDAAMLCPTREPLSV